MAFCCLICCLFFYFYLKFFSFKVIPQVPRSQFKAFKNTRFIAVHAEENNIS